MASSVWLDCRNRSVSSGIRWGVPHIFAECSTDLFFAQGLVHAQDRLWQMEFNRRMVAGRLAEILGEVALPLDRWMRTLTLRRVAEFEVSLLEPEIRQTSGCLCEWCELHLLTKVLCRWSFSCSNTALNPGWLPIH